MYLREQWNESEFGVQDINLSIDKPESKVNNSKSKASPNIQNPSYK